MPSLFPLFLKLDGRECLVVGAGEIAEQKLDGLLSAGARIHIVAPQAKERIQQLALGGSVRWSKREFVPSDLHGVALVVAATGNPAVNETVFRKADEQGVLCNAVDEPERCHFYYGSVVQRGDLQIAISTAGHSPALAQRIRKQLEQQFGESYGDWLQWLGHVRRMFFQRPIDPQRRKRTLHSIARAEVYEKFRVSKKRRGIA